MQTKRVTHMEEVGVVEGAATVKGNSVVRVVRNHRLYEFNMMMPIQVPLCHELIHC